MPSLPDRKWSEKSGEGHIRRVTSCICKMGCVFLKQGQMQSSHLEMLAGPAGGRQGH